MHTEAASTAKKEMGGSRRAAVDIKVPQMAMNTAAPMARDTTNADGCGEACSLGDEWVSANFMDVDWKYILKIVNTNKNAPK